MPYRHNNYAYRILPWLQDIFTYTCSISSEEKYTETPVKILILKHIYTESSEPSLEALGCCAVWLLG